MERKRFYVVCNGRHKGLFDAWWKCEDEVAGYPYAKYRGFTNLEDAVAYIYDEMDFGTYILSVGGINQWFEQLDRFLEALDQLEKSKIPFQKNE